jgi:hypothetical protein
MLKRANTRDGPTYRTTKHAIVLTPVQRLPNMDVKEYMQVSEFTTQCNH